jgi:hypothetical protein
MVGFHGTDCQSPYVSKRNFLYPASSPNDSPQWIKIRLFIVRKLVEIINTDGCEDHSDAFFIADILSVQEHREDDRDKK